MGRAVLEALAGDFAAGHPQEAARILASLPAREAGVFLDACSPGVAAQAARFMTAEELAACLGCLEPERAGALMESLPREQIANSLRRLSAERRSGITDLLAPDLKRGVLALLRYPEGCAGAWMEPQVLTVSVKLEASAALAAVARNPGHLRYYVYVVDADQRLVGVVSLRNLMSAAPEASVESLMLKQVHRISARSGREAILDHPGWEQVHALPVVDERNVLVGVLRYETVQRLARAKRQATAGALPAIALGELFWVGSQRVLGELMDVIQQESA